jgi:mono/diheme cytochrome c family protein
MFMILPQRSHAGQTRFEVSEDTVRDRKTGLIWLKRGDMAEKISGSRHNAKQSINTLFTKLNAEEYGDCGNWHLPSKEELETLVEYGATQGYGGNLASSGRTIAKLLTDIGFTDIGNALYWTSSPYPHRTADYWQLNMGNGRFVAGTGATSRALAVCFDDAGNVDVIGKGKAVFENHCSPCHSSKDMGRPRPAPRTIGKLETNKCKFGKNYSTVINCIREGTASGMPRFKNTLSADDIYAVTFYTLTLRCGRYPGF